MLTRVSLLAHLPEYSPFPPKNGSKLFPIRSLVEWWRLEDGNHYLAESNRTRESTNPILKISWTKENGGIDLTVLKSDGKRRAGPFHVSNSTVTPYGYTADLNADGAPDYILTISYGAVGSIGGGVCDVIFVLSAGEQYKISMLTTLYPGPNDFLDLSGDGNFHFLYSAVRSADDIRGKDGKAHNYWTYGLISVDGTTLKWDNSAVSGFPKWIWWTFHANHDETDQLTDEQKRQFFPSERECVISTLDNPCPDYFKH